MSLTLSPAAAILSDPPPVDDITTLAPAAIRSDPPSSTSVHVKESKWVPGYGLMLCYPLALPQDKQLPPFIRRTCLGCRVVVTTDAVAAPSSLQDLLKNTTNMYNFNWCHVSALCLTCLFHLSASHLSVSPTCLRLTCLPPTCLSLLCVCVWPTVVMNPEQ